VSENIDATSAAFKQSCEAVSNGFHALKAEVKREDPELVDFLHKAQHAPETAAHRIVDFYKTRPVIAAIETIIPPVAIVDCLSIKLRSSSLRDQRILKVRQVALSLKFRPFFAVGC
jgi:hypothetical protein